MKVLEINSVPYGSTCKIMLGIKTILEEHTYQVDTATGYSFHPIKELPQNHIVIGGLVGKLIHLWGARITGLNGCFSCVATWKLLQSIKKENYNALHLHNLHGWYLNLPMIFGYIKRHKLPVVWTLHDCWAFTGQCAYFTAAKCDKWKTGCYHCTQIGRYPKSFVDNTRHMYWLKKKWFTRIEKMTLVTPSEWLADLVKESYLKEYDVQVINNGIDLSLFQPTESDFRQKHQIGDKKIVLGVADGWGARKGLDIFCKLAKTLGKGYQIVLVGTDEAVDKKLPDNIISIHRTNNQQELAQIYSAADVFANPTREDNFPTVNIESLACGTPIVTFKTGGSPECINETCGAVVPCDDVDAMEREIRRVCEEKPFTREACVRRAKDFDMWKKFGEYVELYREM